MTGVDKMLVENFVHLQKVLTQMSIKFDHLTHQISGLLKIFEDSAEGLAKREFDFEKEQKLNEKMLQRIDNLFEQNKVIAKGLTLVHDSVNSQEMGVKNFAVPDKGYVKPGVNVPRKAPIQRNVPFEEPAESPREEEPEFKI